MQYKANAELSANNKVTQSFKLLSDANLANLKRVIAALTASINVSVVALNRAIESNSYSRAGFVGAVYDGALPLANNIAAFLNLPAGAPNVAASGVIWQTLVGVLGDAIEVFDDTVTKPDMQFNGARPIVPLNVTDRDAYNGKPQTASYRKLIAKIEVLEKRYATSPSPNLLLDLLLTLAVHNPQGRQLSTMFEGWARYGAAAHQLLTYDPVLRLSTSELRPAVGSVTSTLRNVATALNSRFEGVIETGEFIEKVKADGTKEKLFIGSLPYLLIESHSTSRRVLHPEVKKFLQRMMG